ncbi:glutathione synthetase-like [Clavelina lepadiformis]|uniref:glutathione synthetase-like n=1 Tax=Clavelina lepadiformis TaxID=159417 RepID=UPI0040430EB3
MCVPCLLLPSPIPKDGFQLLTFLQPHINKLIHDVSQDDEFMSSAFKNVIKVEDFTKRLYDIYKASKSYDKQRLDFGILRTDYMFECVVDKSGKEFFNPKQIEINTIASDYGNPNAIILILCNENKPNIFDQRAVEYAIYDLDEHIIVRRKTCWELIASIALSPDGKLFVDDEEVAIVYFRVLYTADDYTDETFWHVRLKVEMSRAILCPSIGYQLAGCKKMQEDLAKPDVLERFIDDVDVVKKLRNTFAGFYELEMKVQVISELGTFGVILARGNDVIENYSAGHLLRSKSHEHNDGGIDNGLSVPDSPFLF